MQILKIWIQRLQRNCKLNCVKVNKLRPLIQVLLEIKGQPFLISVKAFAEKYSNERV
jgi:hypothetical protein